MVLNVRWKFNTNPEKLQAFQNWLTVKIDKTILIENEPGVSSANVGFWEKYTQQAFDKGGARSFDDVRKTSTDISDFYQGTKQQFLESAFSRPAPIERVKLLASRVYTDLKGVTEHMETQMSRVLTDGLINGDGPRKIAKELNKTVDTIGKKRAIVIARTEIIRAHAEGQLEALQAMGVEDVGVQVEFSTAGDNRVCKRCQGLSGNIYKIKKASGIIPVHPQCRCAWLPAGVGEVEDSKPLARPGYVAPTEPTIPKPTTKKVKPKTISTQKKPAKLKPKKSIAPKPKRITKPKPRESIVRVSDDLVVVRKETKIVGKAKTTTIQDVKKKPIKSSGKPTTATPSLESGEIIDIQPKILGETGHIKTIKELRAELDTESELDTEAKVKAKEKLKKELDKIKIKPGAVVKPGDKTQAQIEEDFLLEEEEKAKEKIRQMEETEAILKRDLEEQKQLLELLDQR